MDWVAPFISMRFLQTNPIYWQRPDKGGRGQLVRWREFGGGEADVYPPRRPSCGERPWGGTLLGPPRHSAGLPLPPHHTSKARTSCNGARGLRDRAERREESVSMEAEPGPLLHICTTCLRPRPSLLWRAPVCWQWRRCGR